jgi:uncharacterized LabA/DUF88 family protein
VFLIEKEVIIVVSTEQQYAVLVDAENVSPKYINIIFDEASNYGITTYRRIYGDWTSTRNNRWKEVLLDNSITPIQQYSYTEGKNASDSAMIIDAMDILYGGTIDGFILVSSDSDFTRLASRLRESGMNVIGMGESKTPSAFISACNSFKYLDILFQSIEAEAEEEEEEEERTPDKEPQFNISQKEQKKNNGSSRKRYSYSKKNKQKRSNKKSNSSKPQPQTKLATIRKALKTIILENSDDDSWISLANLGNHLSKRFPDFDVRNYGHKKLVNFVQSLNDFEIEHRSISSDGKTKQLFVRIK